MINFSEKPKQQQFHLDGVKHISVFDANEAFVNKKAIPIDVREEFEAMDMSIDCDELMIFPMSRIVDIYENLPKNKALVLICASGGRSVKTANFLIRQGFTEVYNLDGGLLAWRVAGLPIANGSSCSSGCNSCNSGCDCG